VSGTAVGLLAEALVLLGLVQLGLKLVRLPALQRGLARLAAVLRTDVRDAQAQTLVAWALTRASRWVPGARCLTRALAGQVMLGRRGLPADLRLGVARTAAGGVEAHAWLERAGGVVVGDVPDLGRYARLPPIGTTV
jgi:hypothetical protein